MLVDEDTPFENLKVSLSVNSFYEEEKGYYRTVTCMTSHVLQRIPKLGITLFSGYFYEVVDINDNRIDKFLVTILPDN